MDKTRILVVEDEESIRGGLCDLLAFHGHAPVAAVDGDEGLAKGLAERFDLVLLDVMMPGLDGFEVCRRLRQSRPRLPILMLTAKGAEDDVVMGLRAGADDYVTKPFSLRELVARVDALLRRSQQGRERPERFPFGQWTVEVSSHRAHRDGGSVDLTPRELALLELFARRAGQVLSRRVLLEEVWDLRNVEEIETRTVDVHIAKLRRKIDDEDRRLIETLRGAGYRANLGTSR